MKVEKDMMVVLYQLNCGRVMEQVRGGEGEGEHWSDYSEYSLR